MWSGVVLDSRPFRRRGRYATFGPGVQGVGQEAGNVFTALSCFLMFLSVVHVVAKTFYVRIVARYLVAGFCRFNPAGSGGIDPRTEHENRTEEPNRNHKPNCCSFLKKKVRAFRAEDHLYASGLKSYRHWAFKRPDLKFLGSSPVTRMLGSWVHMNIASIEGPGGSNPL